MALELGPQNRPTVSEVLFAYLGSGEGDEAVFTVVNRISMVLSRGEDPDLAQDEEEILREVTKDLLNRIAEEHAFYFDRLEAVPFSPWLGHAVMGVGFRRVEEALSDLSHQLG